MPCSPTSAIVFTSGYSSASHMMICGLISSGAITEIIGRSAHAVAWLSSEEYAMWIESSV